MLENKLLAIPKQELGIEDLVRLTDRRVVRAMVEHNLSELQGASFYRDRKGIFKDGVTNHILTKEGSLIVHDLEVLPEHIRRFLEKDGRVTQTRNGIEARGARYLAAIDPNISVPQKLHVYREDFVDGINALKKSGVDSREQYKTVSPVLDYIKNTAVTLLNAYIQKEKIGNFRMEDSSYQNQRAALIRLTRKAIVAFYGSLLDELTSEQMQDLFDESASVLISNVCDELALGFKDYTFSSDYLVRPEASHPLTNLATAYLISERYPTTETIVGFPAGSTELACLTAEALEHYSPDNSVELILLPFSLHSSKKQFRGHDIKSSESSMMKRVRAYRPVIDGKKVLLIDDNSSTGRTMQKAAEIIHQYGHPLSLNCAVAESDIIRTEIDLNESKRTHIANPVLYKDSVGILPVSKKLRPKHNLREVMEQKKLAIYYKKKAEEASGLEERIKYEVFADGAEQPTYVYFDKHTGDEIIDMFHGTFLSNFYTASVRLKGVWYPSVEHAYQSAKFDPESIRSLSKEKQEEIREFLRVKGYGRSIADLSTIFADNTITSGIIKVVADRLKEFGIVAADWDERRVDTMTRLLIQKFQDPKLARQILETGDKILIEGNDWEDTFWGVNKNSRKGRNILGRLLMNIREKLRTGELKLVNPPEN